MRFLRAWFVALFHELFPETLESRYDRYEGAERLHGASKRGIGGTMFR